MIKSYKIGAMIFLLALYSSQSISATAKNVKCKGCVGSTDLANNAVTESKIKNGAVTFDKLGPDVQVILDAVDNNDTRITALEGGGGGGGVVSATPVTINCPSAGAIQTAIDSAAPVGRLTITINGTCNENVVVNRNNVTLLGGENGVIQGLVATATVSAEDRRGLIIKNISIFGGLAAVLLDGSEAKIISSTIGDNTTERVGMLALISQVEFIGGALGNTLTGGSGAGDNSGLVLLGNSTGQFSSGDNTIQGGVGGSLAIVVGIGSTLISGDPLTTGPDSLSVTGDVEVFGGTIVLDQASITGNVTVSQNSTAILETEAGKSVSVSGTLYVRHSSSAQIVNYGDDDGTLSIQNLDIGPIGSVFVDHVGIGGNATLSSFASLVFQENPAVAIPGTFNCLDQNSRIALSGGLNLVADNSHISGNDYTEYPTIDGIDGGFADGTVICGYAINDF